MLILTRNLSQSIVIGDDIQVTVLRVNGTQVRIGIAAPKEVSVHREEIYRRIHEDRETSGSPSRLAPSSRSGR